METIRLSTFVLLAATLCACRASERGAPKTSAQKTSASETSAPDTNAAAKSTAPKLVFERASAESVGWKTADLARISADVRSWIDAGEAVGAEFMILKDRKVVLHEVAGWKDVERKEPMEPNTIVKPRLVPTLLRWVDVENGHVLFEHGWQVTKGLPTTAQTLEFSDWRETSGVDLPAHVVRKSWLGGKLTIDYDKIDVNVEIAPAVFACTESTHD